MMPIASLFASVLFLLLAICAGQAFAEIRVTDDAGTVLVLDAPANRIVSLSPHITELLYAAGAGAYLVGAAEFSDYPEAALRVLRVSGGSGIDLEAIVALEPDLVIAWKSGNPAAQVARLRSLGLNVFLSEPRRLEDVASALSRFGELAGTGDIAGREAKAYLERLEQVRRRYDGVATVSVFYQAWAQPLMTVNGDHIISDVIRLCGGRNVFADLPTLAPQVGMESVLATDPDVIVAGGVPGDLAAWRDRESLRAVRTGALAVIPADLLARHTQRILDGAEQLCGYLEAVRTPGDS